MQKILKFFLFFVFINSAFANDISIDLSLQKNKLSGDWPLMPKLPNSFKKFESDLFQIKLNTGKYNLRYLTEDFSGSGVRQTYPKIISSNINTKKLGIDLDLTSRTKFQFFFGRSFTDPELFDCYQKGVLIIGGCSDSDFQISSTLSQYDRLKGNILYVEGNSQFAALHLNFIPEYSVLDALKISWLTQKTKFNWLTPVEDINSPVILNSVINGVRVGSIIDELLLDLPQRDSWQTNILTFGARKNFTFENFNFFIEQDFLIGNRVNFYKFEDNNKMNSKLILGFEKKIDSFEFKIMGNFYTNFLLWEKEELYNYRTKDYFEKNFGSIVLEINYRYIM
tara:strand:- start:146 stop:1159 length:1014 start_codon:yes stop_codon:yes gene_type:complete